jgi:hypothetical protein
LFGPFPLPLPAISPHFQAESVLHLSLIQMAKIHTKKCSPSLAIKEMQMKTTLRFHSPLLEQPVIFIRENFCLFKTNLFYVTGTILLSLPSVNRVIYPSISTPHRFQEHFFFLKNTIFS